MSWSGDHGPPPWNLGWTSCLLENCRPLAWSDYPRPAVHDDGGDDGGGDGGGGNYFHDDGVMHFAAEE